VRGGGVKAFVTVMEGCNKRCTYCIVPRTRGTEESRSLAHVIQEVRFLIDRGYREVELLGQNVNTYHDGHADFAALLRAVDRADGIERIRFTTSHPLHFTDEIIEAMATAERVCPSVHLPVQSGSSRVLRRMRRGYDRERYLDRIRRLRDRVPGCTVSTDIIVGFPGETDEDFETTMSLIDEIRYEKVFSFLFSPRAGTVAEGMEDTLPLEVKLSRLARLQERQRAIQMEIHTGLVGRALDVLVEGPARTGEGIYTGRSPENFLVHFPGHDGMIGRGLPVSIDSCTPLAVYGNAAPEIRHLAHSA
jgi:tRNA-2-methylthio-N6-dimethylallyladenosine synthase